jgi:hypothetical protein
MYHIGRVFLERKALQMSLLDTDVIPFGNGIDGGEVDVLLNKKGFVSNSNDE